MRTEIARLLGWPENKVRVKVPYVGSGYGSKLYIKLEALALALSMIARGPVKVAATMEEMFYQITKHPSTFRIKSGVDKDGRIVARKCEVFWNGGAYADIGPRVTAKGRPDRVRSLQHRQRRCRLLRALHERHAVRLAARIWRAAACMGLRKPHGHDGARARSSIRPSSGGRICCAKATCTPRARLISDAPLDKVLDTVLGPDRRGRQPFDRGTARSGAAAASASQSRRWWHRPLRLRSSMYRPTVP